MTIPTSPNSPTCAHLLSLAAHELRTPASVINGYLRMLREATSRAEEGQQRMIAEAERSCGRVAMLADELSAIAALEMGTLPLASDRIDAFAVTADAVAAVVKRQPRPVSIVLRGDPSGALMTADRSRIQAALEAVVSAVSRPQPETVTVVVHCSLQPRAASPEAVILVAPDAELEPARLAPLGPLDERPSGLGLALPLARRVIEQHSGRIGSPEINLKMAGPILVTLPIGH